MSIQEIFIEENQFIFETVMRVRNTEVDVGQYLTIEALTAILTEARSRFFYSKNIKEVNSDYQGLITTDYTVGLPLRVRCREELLIEVGVPKINEEQANLHFKVSRMHDGSLVSKASMTVVNFDYRHHKIVRMSDSIISLLKQTPFEL